MRFKMTGLTMAAAAVPRLLLHACVSSRGHRSVALLAMALLAVPASLPALASDPGASAPLQFRITEGRIENAFYQDDDIAAHLLLSSGNKPRVLVAFPAGDSGVGVWFEPTVAPVRWTLGEVKGEHRMVGGHAWNGIVADVSVAADTLVLQDAVLGSIRVLRDYQLGQGYPPETAAAPQLSQRSVQWRRNRLDGAPGYAIALSTDNGRFQRDGSRILLRPDRAGEPLRLRIEATTGETPLTPFTDLLNEHAQADLRSRQALQFLSYREKFLAGSWRFDTYFGRDTLMSLRLLMPVLRPAAVDAGIASVLARLSPDGEVAHEEDIGEFAVLRHRKEQGSTSAEPIYNYVMIDSDYMLAPVAAAWLLEDARGRAGAAAFLASGAKGRRQGDALVRNLLFVAASSEAFARKPVYANLIALKPNSSVGQWRDSNEGIGRGRYPYDVNAVWMPAALRAIGDFLDAGVLDAYVSPEQRERLRAAAASLGAPPWRVWRTIDWRLLRGPIALAAGFAFAIAMGEFGATAFVARPDRPTLPLAIARLLSRPGAQNVGMGFAAAVLLAVVTAAAMLATERLRTRVRADV